MSWSSTESEEMSEWHFLKAGLNLINFLRSLQHGGGDGCSFCGAGISLGKGGKRCCLFNWVYSSMLQIFPRWLNQHFVFIFNSFNWKSFNSLANQSLELKLIIEFCSESFGRMFCHFQLFFFFFFLAGKNLWALVKIVVWGWEQALLPQFWLLILYIPNNKNNNIFFFYLRTFRCHTTDKKKKNLNSLGSCCWICPQE